MNGYEVYNYIKANSEIDAYTHGLCTQLESMNIEQLEYFGQEIASRYIKSDGTLDLNQAKAMEKLARYTVQGLDVSSLAGQDYQTILQSGNVFPPLNTEKYKLQTIMHEDVQHDYTPQSYIQPEPTKTPSEIIYDIINTDMVVGAQSEGFIQSANITSVESVPLQGWKFHISANNLEDYQRLCEVAIPEFQAKGVQFKVVRPEQFENFPGKAITIYPSPSFNFNDFSPKLQSVLSENSIQPRGDANIQGRINARYGRFREPVPNTGRSITAPDSTIGQDPKFYGSPIPTHMQNVTIDGILNFYGNAQQKLQMTGDFKTYLQEYYTMAECDGKSHSFMCVEISETDFNLANNVISIPKNNSNSLTFIGPPEQNGTRKMMIHVSDIPQAFYGLADAGIQAIRPEWDAKYTYHEIHPSQVQSAIQVAKEMNQQFGMNAVSVVQVDDNRFAIKCDSVFNKATEEMCINAYIGLQDFEPQEKGNITKFVEKLTGKELGFTEKDITHMANDLGNDTRDNQQQNIGDDDAR